jgi:hypothetical protein
MKHFLALLTLIAVVSCKRVEKHEAIPVTDMQSEEISEFDAEAGCIYQKSTSQFASSTPFGQSDKVEIVSYPIRDLRGLGNELIRNGKFMVHNIQQRVVLNKTDQDSLYSILYNFTIPGEPMQYPGADCYNPQHCIVFYKNNQAFAYYEICFMCSRTAQSDGIDVISFCEEKWCLLQKFFKNNNVDYGLMDEMCE